MYRGDNQNVFTSLKKYLSILMALALTLCVVPANAQNVVLTSAVGTSTLTYSQAETVTRSAAFLPR